jgi:hypothetical protein
MRHHVAILVREDPSDAEAQMMQGNLQLAFGEFASALATFNRLCESSPGVALPWVRKGTALMRLGDLAAAESSFNNALRRDPAHADAHWHKAQLLLLAGRYEEGWEEFEWRWRHHQYTSLRPSYNRPVWDGGPIAGKTILLHPEQGYGDTVQCIRYASLLSARGATVIAGSPPELAGLVRTAPGVAAVYERPEEVPAFDVYTAMMGLPRLLGTTLTSIPAPIPYLHADAGLRALWAERLRAFGEGLRVGLVWSGNPLQESNRYRSCSLGDLASLGDMPEVVFFSLQKGAPAAELVREEVPIHVNDLGPALVDFRHTAAALANLDLLITTDTSIAHVGGALGRDVWLLLSSAPDWRWMLGREDSPWYPTTRLFRQEKPLEWGSVVERVRRALTIALRSGAYANR